ncbi:hypothetical protein ES703_70459 [subsurface metagenome]
MQVQKAFIGHWFVEHRTQHFGGNIALQNWANSFGYGAEGFSILLIYTAPDIVGNLGVVPVPR